MSIQNIDHAMIRIESAPASKPLAVFRCNIPGHVNVMFSDTVTTQVRIEQKDPTLIGVFDETMNMRQVRQKLTVASREALTE